MTSYVPIRSRRTRLRAVRWNAAIRRKPLWDWREILFDLFIVGVL